ncbi:hypothetical protein K456DRAFT_334016 [Colletotrichum gloeosporioides 23]|nr:hypothetical protein K456DRAFT_334016 [Colletotrichum gloeosporioides 23]
MHSPFAGLRLSSSSVNPFIFIFIFHLHFLIPHLQRCSLPARSNRILTPIPEHAEPSPRLTGDGPSNVWSIFPLLCFLFPSSSPVLQVPGSRAPPGISASTITTQHGFASASTIRITIHPHPPNLVQRLMSVQWPWHAPLPLPRYYRHLSSSRTPPADRARASSCFAQTHHPHTLTCTCTTTTTTAPAQKSGLHVEH